MTVARFTPLNDFVSLRAAMERLRFTVPVDLWETPDAYHLRADLPGLAPEDIEVNATSDTISIAGEMKAQANISDEGWLRQERRVGKFQRSFTLPIQIEPNKVEAKFTNGVLELVLPKAESVKPRTIKINAADQK